LQDIRLLEEKLKYQFKDSSLLELALTHASYTNEMANSPLENYQRLEFLGDAILDSIIAHTLYKRFPEFREGKLTQLKSKLVCERSLSEVAKSLDFQNFIRMGHGELLSQGNERASVLADVFEAVVAAIFLDADLDVARRFVLSQFEAKLDEPEALLQQRNAKSMLQELAQAKSLTHAYVDVESKIDAGEAYFVVDALVGEEVLARAQGRSKKEAEQSAAAKAILRLLEREGLES